MKKILQYIFLLQILLSISYVANWYSWEADLDNTKSLKEIKNNLADLKEEKVNLKQKLNLFIEETWELKKFFKKNLSKEDLSNIKEIVDLYNVYSNKLEEQLKKKAKDFENSSEEKSLLLKEKLNAYKKLTPYIDVDKLPNYLEYIKGDLIIFKEKKDVNELIYVNEEILNQKVENIKEKIVKNKELLDDKKEEIIKNKIDEKINILKENKKFKNLTNEEKKEIILNIIEKIKIKIKKIETDWQKNILINKKIDLYNTVLISLDTLYNNY